MYVGLLSEAISSFFFSKNAKKMKNCMPATIVSTCKFRDIFFVYTVIFQHFFQSSITRPMKSMFKLKILYRFLLRKNRSSPLEVL